MAEFRFSARLDTLNCVYVYKQAIYPNVSLHNILVYISIKYYTKFESCAGHKIDVNRAYPLKQINMCSIIQLCFNSACVGF